MIYAPIIIPTLNRYVHLERCIKSLQQNKWACHTELYISLDFPPAEKYVEGYKKVKEYLETGIDGFKAVHIYVQKSNLGPFENANFLRNEVKEAGYDCYIASEDDNEFSPNFIEYMDKCLDYFKEDEKALGVCAAQKGESWFSNGGNIVLQNICPAYGIGCWFAKDDKVKAELNDGFINEIGKQSKLLRSLKRKNVLCFRAYMISVVFSRNNIFWNENKVVYCDTIRSIYATVTDSYYVGPVKSKARNWGFDGSGVNMKAEEFDPIQVYKLDEDEEYSLILPNPMQLERKNVQIHNKQLKVGLSKYIIANILYCIYVLTGRDYKKCLRIRKRIEELF